MTKVYHPNIDEEGAICIALLKNDQWKPATPISQGTYTYDHFPRKIHFALHVGGEENKVQSACVYIVA